MRKGQITRHTESRVTNRGAQVKAVVRCSVEGILYDGPWRKDPSDLKGDFSTWHRCGGPRNKHT